MALQGFTAFNFNEGAAYVSITNNGVTFNKSVTIKLGSPEYVLLLVNDEERQIALQICDKLDANATLYYRPKESGVMSVRWNSRDLINTLETLMGWDLSQQSFKAFGTLIKSECAMIFDLNKAIAL